MPSVTDEELRVQELVKDLAEHTGFSKENRPGVGAALQKLHNLNALKQASKRRREKLPWETAESSLEDMRPVLEGADRVIEITSGEQGIIVVPESAIKDD